MRKEWIRTDEECRLRQMIQFAKEERRIHHRSVEQVLPLNVSLVARKKKRIRALLEPPPPAQQVMIVQRVQPVTPLVRSPVRVHSRALFF